MLQRLGMLGEHLIEPRDVGIGDRAVAQRLDQGAEFFEQAHPAPSIPSLPRMHWSRRSWARLSAL